MEAVDHVRPLNEDENCVSQTGNGEREEHSKTSTPYTALLQEFKETRQKLAEARVHIDKLRFGSNFTVDHCFELLFKNQNESLKSDCDSSLDSTCSLPKQQPTNSTSVDGATGTDAWSALHASHTQDYPETVTTSSCTTKDRLLYSKQEDQVPTLKTSDRQRGDSIAHIREIQEQVAAVSGLLQNRNSSLDELCAHVSLLQQQHQEMAGDICQLVHGGGKEEGSGNNDIDGGEREILQREVNGRMMYM